MYVAVPSELEMAAFGTIGNDEPAGAGHRHHHFSRPAQVGHLRDRRPPDDVRLDLVELAKGAVDSRLRPQRRIDLAGRPEESRVGKECVSTWNARWAPCH